MGKFFSNLIGEIASNGKMLVAYALTQAPLTNFPGLGTAIHTAVTDHTPSSYIDVAIQGLMLVGAAMRTKKIVVAAAAKS